MELIVGNAVIGTSAIIGFLGVLFFLSQLGGTIKDEKKHRQIQRDTGNDGHWDTKADNAFTDCFVIAGVVVFVVVMVFGGLAVGGG